MTGATGFLAGHVVADLLRHGYRVRGTVRDLGNTAKSAHLTSMKGAGENLELVQADLLDDDASWQKVVTGVHIRISHGITFHRWNFRRRGGEETVQTCPGGDA